jgi:predicted DNA-binding WGR domain protein
MISPVELPAGIAQFEDYAHLTSVDPAERRFRFYALRWQRTLWGDEALVCRWGRVGAEGKWRARYNPDRASAQDMIARVLRMRLQHTYQVVDWR